MNKEILLEDLHDLIDSLIKRRVFEDEIFVFYAESDITKANFFKWCEMCANACSDHTELSPEERKQYISAYKELKLLANYNETWNRVKDIFYRNWLASNAIVFRTLVRTINLDHNSFLNLLEKAVDLELESYEDLEEKELNRQFLHRLNNLLSDKNVFMKVKLAYFRVLFDGVLLLESVSRIKKLNSQDLMNSMSNFIKEAPLEIRYNMTEEEIINTAYQITQPDNLKYYAKYLASEEQKGYIAFRAYCQTIKEITFNHIKHIISIKKYIKSPVYPNSFEEFQYLIKSFDYLGPDEIINLYYPNHKYSLNCISHLINSCLVALLNESNDKLFNILLQTKEQSTDYLYKSGSTLFINLYENFLIPRFNKLDLLISKVFSTFENYSGDRKKDGMRSLVGGLTGSGLFSMFKITQRELTIHSKVQNDLNNILTFYNNYLNDLENYEDFLIQHYEKYFDRWFELHIDPLAKSIFQNLHPMRKSYGLRRYENFLSEKILSVKKEFEELTPVVDLDYEPYLDSEAFKTYTYKKTI